MNGGKNRQPLGYTIVEVMVVLAVSGVMFLIAASFINGKQERSAFTAGINDMASQIQDVIEQVTDGKYSDIPLGCSTGGGSIGFSASGTQGTNSDCVFQGKVLQFVAGSPNYTVSSLAAIRVSGTTTPTIEPGPNSVHPTIIPNLDVAQTVPQSLTISGTSVTDTGGQHNNVYYVFGFVQSPGASNSGGFQSGGQTTELVYSHSPSLPSATPADLYAAHSVTLCLSDGNQRARLIIGGTGSQLGVNVQRVSVGAPCP